MFVSFRPTADLVYEHVFCSQATSTLVQRARGALSLTRSFLLLEDDDHPVDWEVDRENERIGNEEPVWAHAHRRSLRGRRAARRPGQLRPRPQPCLCPIERTLPNRVTAADRYDDLPCPARSCPAPSSTSSVS